MRVVRDVGHRSANQWRRVLVAPCPLAYDAVSASRVTPAIYAALHMLCSHLA